ncbi:MAG: hypothetical protein K2Y28_07115 [Burkholderiaceae bacterium]|nr:hypothetical protein [Burkholderiaceae bacterium]
MTHCSTIAEVIEITGSLVRNAFGAVIIDGFDRSGKTTVTREIGQYLGLCTISVDDFFDGKGRSYKDSIDFVALKDKVHVALKESPNVVIEGLCMRDIAGKLDIAISSSVYMMACSKTTGLWLHERLIAEAPSASLVEDAILECRPLGGMYLNYLYRDLIEYHLREKPEITSSAMLQITV